MCDRRELLLGIAKLNLHLGEHPNLAFAPWYAQPPLSLVQRLHLVLPVRNLRLPEDAILERPRGGGGVMLLECLLPTNASVRQRHVLVQRIVQSGGNRGVRTVPKVETRALHRSKIDPFACAAFGNLDRLCEERGDTLLATAEEGRAVAVLVIHQQGDAVPPHIFELAHHPGTTLLRGLVL